VHGQEFHTSYWGHRGILKLRQNILLPGYADIRIRGRESVSNECGRVRHGACAGRSGGSSAFRLTSNRSVRDASTEITDELPVDVAAGKLDYLEIVGFSDHKATAAVCIGVESGFRVPAGGGTDATHKSRGSDSRECRL